MTQRSPGPWSVAPYKDYDRQPMIYDANTDVVCRVDINNDNDPDQTATLIAATPDLLEALNKIDAMRYAGRQTVNPENAFEAFGALNRQFVECCDIAREAIAKATPPTQGE